MGGWKLSEESSHVKGYLDSVDLPFYCDDPPENYVLSSRVEQLGTGASFLQPRQVLNTTALPTFKSYYKPSLKQIWTHRLVCLSRCCAKTNKTHISSADIHGTLLESP